MRDLSIVIRASEDKVLEYIKILEPILNCRECELIIISNTINGLNIKHKYTLYRFSGSSNKFKEFCFSITMGKKVIIIDGNIQLFGDFVDDVMMHLNSPDFNNVAYKFRKFLSTNKPIYYVDTNVLIYNRGIIGFNVESQIEIDDYTLLDGDCIQVNLNKFIESKCFNELYLWYKHSILNHLKDYKQYFYELLEFEKTSLEDENRTSIEELFINGNEDMEYCEYLSMRREIFSKNALNLIPCSEKINSHIALNNTRYYSWLIYEIIKDRHDLLNIIFNIHIDSLKKTIDYLLSYNDFHEYLYDFIFKTNGIDCEDEKIKLSETNIMLIKTYISFANTLQADPELKNKLLKLFQTYIQINEILLKDCNSTPPAFDDYSERDFTIRFQEAFSYIEKRDINPAAALLKSLSLDYPDLERVIRYYIQKLRIENNCFQSIISICMIVRDEEKNLHRCLSSLMPLLDSIAELIIVDTGSTDKTVKIAREYTQNVYFYKWQGSFSDARNYSLSLAEGEYIFLLDADEEIEEFEINIILNHFKQPSYKSYNTYTLKIKNYTDVLLKEYAIITQPRIFKNDLHFYYSGKVHNQPVFQLPALHLSAYITHYGYIMTEDIKDKKFQRTANMLKLELQKSPKNIYYRFQLSTSYAMHGDLSEALDQAEIYMRSIREENILNDNYLMHYNNAVILYISSGQLDEASNICNDALKINPDFIDFIYYKAQICYESYDYEDALQYTNKYLELIDSFMNIDISNDGRYSFYTLGLKNDVIKIQILCHYMMGNYDEVINIINSFKDASYKDCLHAIVLSFLKENRYSDLIKFYNNYCSDESTKLIFRYFLEDGIQKSQKSEDAIVLSILTTLDCYETHRDELKNMDNSKDYTDINEALYVIENYNIDSLSLFDARRLFNRLLPSYNSYVIEKTADIKEVFRYKKLGSYILHRAAELNRFRDYTNEKLINILRKYIYLSSFLIMNKRTDLLPAKEQLFLIKITEAFKKLGAEDYNSTLNLLNQVIEVYRPMEGLIKIIQNSVIPNFKDKSNNSKPVTIIKSGDESVKSYAQVVKEKIVEYAGIKSNKELLDIFEKFSNKELYDSELYSYKAVLLMSEGSFNEAQLEIKEGLIRYKNDIRLLSNLSRLYSLTKEFEKCLEAYCRVKMLSKDNCQLRLNELIPEECYATKSNRLKVLHGTMFADNRVSKLSAKLSGYGIYSRTLSYSPRYTGYTCDYCIDMNQYEKGSEIISKTLDAASTLIPKFDIFNFHYGSTLTFDYSDLPLLNELGKKVLVQFWGDEVKAPSNTAKGEAINEKLSNLCKYISICIVPNEEIYSCVKDFFKETHIIKEGQIDKLIELYKSL